MKPYPQYTVGASLTLLFGVLTTSPQRVKQYPLYLYDTLSHSPSESTPTGYITDYTGNCPQDPGCRLTIIIRRHLYDLVHTVDPVLRRVGACSFSALG